MGQYDFVVADVFTDKPLAGNPLAVFPDVTGLDEQTMQAIAREFGHSETTFILPSRRPEAAWRLRCFTPQAEVFGAGHNALGAWWVLAAKGRVSLNSGSTTVVRQELGERVLPLELSHPNGTLQRVVMNQARPVFGETLDDLGALGQVLGLPVSDLDLSGLRPQAVSTGAQHLLVPVQGLSSLAKLHVDAGKLLALVRPLGCEGAYVFTLETREPGSRAHARAFFPGIGIVEDPATGSAAGPLGALLARHQIIPEATFVVIEQGDEAARPSRIEVRVTADRVEVGGRCVIVAQGSLLL
jgi:trans-2,3-dihydro-3-hydroxyanthranilate isomerase